MGWSIYAQPNDYKTFSFAAAHYAVSPNDPANTFANFLAIPTNMQMWLQLKELIVVGAVFFIVWMIYYEEARIRFGSIFRFGHMLDMALRNMVAVPSPLPGHGAVEPEHGASRTLELINGHILDFMAIEVNVEAVIAVSDAASGRRVLAAFQTHGSRSDILGPTDWSDPEELSAFDSFVTELQDPAVREEHCQATFRETLRSLQSICRRRQGPRALERVVLERLGIEGTDLPDSAFSEGDIWVFEGTEDQSYLRRMRTMFFSGEPSRRPGSIREKLFAERQVASMYPTLQVVTVVVVRVKEWWLFFVNNFPASFRMVPQVFWTDGLEKIQIAKFLLDRY